MNFPPRDRPLRSLRARLLMFMFLPLAAVLVVSLAVGYRLAFAPASEAYDHALLDDVVELAGRVHVKKSIIEVDLPAAVEAVLRNDSHDQEFLSIYGPDGSLLAGDEGLLPETSIAEHNPSLGYAEWQGEKVRKASYRVETAVGFVTVTVAETMRKRDRAASKILAAMIIPNVLLIVVTLGLIYFGIRSGLAPLMRLSNEIGRRSPHDLSPLPSCEVPGEVEPLIRSIDLLITDLRAASIAQQAFLANAAHQFKTPLAGLQTQLELAIQEIPNEHRVRVENLRDATQRLGHLAHQLLALARSGQGVDIAYEKRPVDLGKLLEASSSSWFDLALVKGIDLGFEPEKAMVFGSEWLLRELLNNLIDNALCYTPEGGKVTARSGVDLAGHAFVEVEDNGIGVPTSERERIFERFYRPEGSVESGTGLGLAIVKEVAERHGAMIQLIDADPKPGICFRICFASGT